LQSVEVHPCDIRDEPTAPSQGFIAELPAPDVDLPGQVHVLVVESIDVGAGLKCSFEVIAEIPWIELRDSPILGVVEAGRAITIAPAMASGSLLGSGSIALMHNHLAVDRLREGRPDDHDWVPNAMESMEFDGGVDRDVEVKRQTVALAQAVQRGVCLLERRVTRGRFEEMPRRWRLQIRWIRSG
jgi:hypothetical protein